MSKILALASTGFGKTTSALPIDYPEGGISIKGLDPSDTFILSATSKPLPSFESNDLYPATDVYADLYSSKRFITNDAELLALVITDLIQSPFKNILVDDFNYFMQDWYMANALAKGWDAPKTIGFFIGKVFDAFELADKAGKNVIIMAHPEFFPTADGRQEIRMKTTGKMVDEYVTPAGKFDVVLYGESRYDVVSKKVVREYLTNENHQFKGPKAPIGMFSSAQATIPNDLSIVIDAVNKYYSRVKK